MIKELIKTEYVCEYLLNIYNNLPNNEYFCISFTTTTETPKTGLYHILLMMSSQKESYADWTLFNAYFDREILLDFFKRNDINFIEELVTFEEIEEQLNKINPYVVKMAYDIKKTSYLYLGKHLTADKVRKLV